MSVGFIQTEMRTSAATVDGATWSLMARPNAANTAFVQSVDSKNMIQMKNFAQGAAKIVASAANKNHEDHGWPAAQELKNYKLLKNL